jgi:hypothetical protein
MSGFVIPAKAGIHVSTASGVDQRIPACAGVTVAGR